MIHNIPFLLHYVYHCQILCASCFEADKGNVQNSTMCNDAAAATDNANIEIVQWCILAVDDKIWGSIKCTFSNFVLSFKFSL